jgi:hypothetical protein
MHGKSLAQRGGHWHQAPGFADRWCCSVLFYIIAAVAVSYDPQLMHYPEAENLSYPTRPPTTNNPAGVTPASTARSSKLYRLNATENKTWLEFMLKVMAGLRWIYLATPTISIPPK